jgi:stearoyl-CoA desaturase (delta-9 desaturase)
VVLLHATLLINSLAHRLGSQRYDTQDDSRNNFLLALLTLGEGWHNNHHYHAASARQGFYWWEIDISFYLLWLMQKMGLIWDVRTVPISKRDQLRSDEGTV